MIHRPGEAKSNLRCPQQEKETREGYTFTLHSGIPETSGYMACALGTAPACTSEGLHLG